MQDAESQVTLEVKLFIKEADSLVKSAAETLEAEYTAKERLKHFEDRHKNRWHLWIFGAIFFVALAFGSETWATVAFCIGVVYEIAIQYDKNKYETDVGKWAKKFGELVKVWSEKFGDKEDFYKLAYMFELKNASGPGKLDFKEREFQYWWLTKKENLYSFAIDRDTARELMKDEWKWFRDEYKGTGSGHYFW